MLCSKIWARQALLRGHVRSRLHWLSFHHTCSHANYRLQHTWSIKDRIDSSIVSISNTWTTPSDDSIGSEWNNSLFIPGKELRNRSVFFLTPNRQGYYREKKNTKKKNYRPLLNQFLLAPKQSVQEVKNSCWLQCPCLPPFALTAIAFTQSTGGGGGGGGGGCNDPIWGNG